VRTPLGPATLRLAQHLDGAVHAYAWGAGAEWAIDGVPELLGAGDDWSDLDVARTPLLADALRRHPGLRLTRCRQVFEMLVAAILEQKIATVDAHRSWAWLVRRHGEPAPGPAPEGMRVAPAIDGHPGEREIADEADQVEEGREEQRISGDREHQRGYTRHSGFPLRSWPRRDSRNRRAAIS